MMFLVLVAVLIHGSSGARPEGHEGTSLALGKQGRFPVHHRQLANDNTTVGLGTDKRNRLSIGRKLSSDAAPAEGESSEGDEKESQGVPNNRAHSSSLGVWALVTAGVTSASTVFVCVVVFSALRARYPMVYSHNVEQGIAPRMLSATFLGWIDDSLQIETLMTDTHRVIGLDNALLLGLCEFSIKLLVLLGLPMMLILCPIYATYGTATVGSLGRLGMGAVEHGSWVCWLCAAMVWAAVLVSQRMVFAAQRQFLNYRWAWLRSLPRPQATTVLVERIPEEHRSDQGLRDFFGRLFTPEEIETAVVLKRTGHLPELLNELSSVELLLHEAEFRQRSLGSIEQDAPQDLTDRQDEISRQITEARNEIMQKASTNDKDIHAATGFVTFKSTRAADSARLIRCTSKEDELIISRAPHPTDVMYQDLCTASEYGILLRCVGYVVLVLLFFGFVPLVVAISSLADLDFLETHIAIVRHVLTKAQWLRPLVQGVLASVTLDFCISLIPTALMLIFTSFFTESATAQNQYSLHTSYFWFQIVFVLLITTIGGSLMATAIELESNPNSAIRLLSSTLPKEGHFFMSFLLMKCSGPAVHLVRIVNLMKYRYYTRSMMPEKAKQLAEPEDEDCQGIGARSAEVSFAMVLALVFCTLVPLITLVAIPYFLSCRIFWGYLTAFAEDRKPDLGGAFWVSQLKHVQFGLFIYVWLMIGVLMERGAHVQLWYCSFSGPGACVVPSLIFLSASYAKFNSIEWENLPHEEEALEKPALQAHSTGYVQPELRSCT
eukprot:TRINITY_DN33321_c0_g1_i1.p1 TRINITY_DN33321_c0_g1~~TRINITY_DN33321_c0_g1_i1.p1  ORF type:complete len:777 (-),score=113.78 TRINITY_DN33321_c0_g1_i1:11-2341(-)